MLLIKNAILLDPQSKHHQKKRDILIEKGLIKKIRATISENKAHLLDAGGAFVSPGWLDIGAHTGDPGFEQREDLRSIGRAAVAGGYTGLACLPNTHPVIHSKSEVQYIKNNTLDGLVDFFPIGAVSRDCVGRDITEMFDMHRAGAVAFSDGQCSIQDNGLMMRALQYVKAFGGLIMNQPFDRSIAGAGQMHEGVVSVSLGMKAIPAMAEELMVQRDLQLLEYTNSRLHLANLSSAGSLPLVQKAKAAGQQVTASVAALNLAFVDEHLKEFDANYKVLPPLRATADGKALRRAVKSGLIDIISSNHTPLEPERKDLEFSHAEFGAIGLETTFALCNTVLADLLEPDQLSYILAFRSRQVLGLDVPSLEEGQPANLTIFDANREWQFGREHIYSRSANTPLMGYPFKGKVLGVVNRGQHFWMA